MTDSFYPTTDGVAVAVDVTRKALTAMGHEVFVIAPDPGKEELRLPDVIYFRSKRFRKYEGYFLPIYPSDQTDVVKRLRPDIIHIRGVAVMALKALFAGHNTHVPTVLTYDTVVTEVIGMYSPIKLPKDTLARLASVYLRNLLKRPAAILVPTPSTGRELESMGVRTRRTEVVPTGIDGGRFRFDPEGRRRVRELVGAGDRKVLLFVGRLSFEKHAEVLIDALPLMPGDTVALLVGDGPARASLEEEAARAGVADRVHFAGYIHGSELADYYSSADAFVSPSVFETQGFTVIEAMFCGLTVACGNGRAFTDFIEDGKNGYLFEPVPGKCAEAAMKALSAPESVRRRSMETAESFGIGPCTERLVQVYESVIGQQKVS